MRPKPKPVPIPMVKYKVVTFRANTEAIMHTDAKIAPAIVTTLQPHLFTNELEIGPGKKT